MKSITALAITLLLAACNKQVVKPADPPAVVRMPEVVERVVKAPVYVADELAADCHNESAKAQTYEEAKRLALLRNKSIIECNKRLEKIRKLHGGERK